MISEDLKSELEAMDLKALAIEIVQAKDLLDEAKKAQKERQEYVDYLCKVLVPDRMDEEDISTVNFEGVGRLQKSAQLQTNVKSADKRSLLSFLRKHGYGDMISEQVNPSTLKAWVKELMSEGIEVPKEINVHAYQVATVVKT